MLTCTPNMPVPQREKLVRIPTNTVTKSAGQSSYLQSSPERRQSFKLGSLLSLEGLCYLEPNERHSAQNSEKFTLKRTLMPKPMFILRSRSHPLIIRDRPPTVDCSEPAGGIGKNNIGIVAWTTRTFLTGMTIWRHWDNIQKFCLFVNTDQTLFTFSRLLEPKAFTRSMVQLNRQTVLVMLLVVWRKHKMFTLKTNLSNINSCGYKAIAYLIRSKESHDEPTPKPVWADDMQEQMLVKRILHHSTTLPR